MGNAVSALLLNRRMAFQFARLIDLRFKRQSDNSCLFQSEERAGRLEKTAR
jgi:hypothetical protein